MQEVSTKPYLLRAIYEWCTDNGYTPYIAVAVDGYCRVPMQYVKDGEIILNASFEATSGMKMDNDFIRFSARFGGIPHAIEIPVGNVMAIYASENGKGMAFEVEYRDAGAAADVQSPASEAPALVAVSTENDAKETDVQTADNANAADDKKNEKKSGKPLLKVVK